MWKSLVVFIFLISFSTSDAKTCYVCGPEAMSPFKDDSNYNETAVNLIHKSCEKFDRIPLDEKYKYEMECPKSSTGCYLQVGATVTRSCSDVNIDDCKTVNSNHFCYCNTNLCNGMDAESIIEKYGDVSNDDDEGNQDTYDDGSGSEEDDDDLEYNYRSTSLSRDDTSEMATTESNKIATLSVSPVSDTINKAVNFNLNRNILIFTFVARFFILSSK